MKFVINFVSLLTDLGTEFIRNLVTKRSARGFLNTNVDESRSIKTGKKQKQKRIWAIFVLVFRSRKSRPNTPNHIRNSWIKFHLTMYTAAFHEHTTCDKPSPNKGFLKSTRQKKNEDWEKYVGLFFRRVDVYLPMFPFELLNTFIHTICCINRAIGKIALLIVGTGTAQQL